MKKLLMFTIIIFSLSSCGLFKDSPSKTYYEKRGFKSYLPVHDKHAHHKSIKRRYNNSCWYSK